VTKTSLSWSILSALLIAAPLAQAKAPPIQYKQLAGPPSEFRQMREIDPADAAILSKSALLPIQFEASKSGGVWQGSLPVERGDLRFLVFSGAEKWQLEMTSPSGVTLPASLLAHEIRPTRFGMEKTSVETDQYRFHALEPGLWTLKIRGSGEGQQGFVLIEGNPEVELSSYQTHKRQLAGGQIGLAAMLTAASGEETLLGLDAGRIQEATLRVTYPNGKVASFPMFDDGLHDDGEAGDGVFGGSFPAEKAGSYLAQTVVHGVDASGNPLVRTAEHVIPVVQPGLALGSLKSGLKASPAGDNRLGIAIPVRGEKRSQHYRAIAEVWGRDAEGKPTAVAWIGGMVEPKRGAISLGLDEDWVAMSGAQGPFELRNLRIEDPDHFVVLASAKRLGLELPALRTKKAPGEVMINERMLMGPRPAMQETQLKNTGRRLVLVHGYCSGGVWPTSQFSSASAFLDVNRNRTHDQFARLIRDFGAQWGSFGTVAHSQGGAASLHLYTYYWSGLDNAVGNRLIQSVGTPYQGTNLAGILAALGNWFGVGCGTNDNLTYSGASAWLSGIPSWARGKVNYYTTSFATAWWRYDYCNMATDVVLSDPEDGTTERAYGQLSGAINRGHTTGQCHTAGMRDPAQYLDSSRNSIMNSNAAR
jgi:hypothetical protein